MRRVAGVVIAVALMMLARTSWAAGQLAVALDIEGQGEAPAHVCVVSAGRGEAQVQSTAFTSYLATPAGHRTLDEAAHEVGKLDLAEPVRAALIAMAPSESEPACETDPDPKRSLHCAARLDRAIGDKFVACAANEQPPSGAARVLWLELRAQDDDSARARVEKLTLSGSVVTLATSLTKAKAIKVVGVLGG